MQSRQNLHLYIIGIVFLLLSAWWLTIYFRGLVDENENTYFTLVYPWFSLYGGIIGLVVAARWGGLKSVIGRGLSSFSFGLLAQFFGQASYAYYIYVSGVDVPYPSIGDIGYFGSIIFYVYGVVQLGKATGGILSLKSYSGKMQAFFIPMAMLFFSYWYFLRGYEFDWSSPLIPLLDFGYPLGQAIYVSLAILVYLLSRKKLGGIMRMPLLYLLFALIWQYCCDYVFLYQAYRETWYVGGINDFMYFVSYVAMTLALVKVGHAFKEIRDS